ncbi:ATP-binding protein [Sphingomonas alba]|uniref:ATP-binding protein n=1 Tax=Sphingomonas alba TaxID=2908208 RepID=A0ABT0RQ96_9SPHN|nr:ATP-binding protein [Sphingomonas alba]
MSSSESNPERATLRLKGSDAVGQALAAARAFAEEQWLTDEETARLCIIIEELLTNLYDHGGLTADHEIEMSLIVEPDGLHLTLVDPSPAFDPRAAPSGRRSDRGGGAGIDIVRAWAEIIDYRETREGNRLEVLMPVGMAG